MSPGDPDTQYSFRLSSIGQMPLHKHRNTIWCVLSGQGGDGGMRPLGSKNPAARRQQSGLLCRSIWHICVEDVPMINLTRDIRLLPVNKTLCLSETVKGTKFDERAFRLALGFLSRKECLAADSQLFKYYIFASRSLVNFLTG